MREEIVVSLNVTDEEFQGSVQRVMRVIAMRRRSRPHPQSTKRARIYQRKRSMRRKALIAEIAHIAEDAGVYD